MLAAVLVAWPVRAVPVLDRSASISLARPVSISRAPAPTDTMTRAGTPIRATCHARRRRAAWPAGRRRQPHTAASVLLYGLTRELTRCFVGPARAGPRRAPR